MEQLLAVVVAAVVVVVGFRTLGRVINVSPGDFSLAPKVSR